MKVYLAARYTRRLELCGYRQQIEEAGGEVTSRWLNGDHQIDDKGVPIGENGAALVEDPDGDLSAGPSERAAALRQHFAQEDVADVLAAHVLVAFTETPRSSASRGGRHVEFGLALGLMEARRNSDALHYFGPPMNRVIVVGPRENVFCWLPEVEHYDDWPSALEALRPTLGAVAQWGSGGVTVTIERAS